MAVGDRPSPSPCSGLPVDPAAAYRAETGSGRRAGAEFADRPLVVEVRTRRPLGDHSRTNSPVIVLNGTALSETIPQLPDWLLASRPRGRSLLEGRRPVLCAHPVVVAHDGWVPSLSSSSVGATRAATRLPQWVSASLFSLS